MPASIVQASPAQGIIRVWSRAGLDYVERTIQVRDEIYVNAFSKRLRICGACGARSQQQTQHDSDCAVGTRRTR